MFCHVIQLRREGLRLRQEEWPEPVQGDLTMECRDARDNNFRRTIRQAVVYVRVGVAQRRVGHMHLFDPVMLHTVDDGFILRGIQLRSEATEAGRRVYEHEQMWLCLSTWNGTLQPGLDKVLPES